MKPLVLEVLGSRQQRIDMSALTRAPDPPRAPREVAALKLHVGKRQVRLDEVFSVSGADASRIIIKGDSARLDGLGACMTDTRLVVEGHAGYYTGQAMRSGELHVQGDCGALAACEMHGGRLVIEGDAGDCLGATLPGNRKGMRGGLVIVHGNAGARAGERMRRGTIVIKGDCGEHCAARMIAGTIAVLGNSGAGAGVHMRRGTVLLRTAPARLPATFNGPDKCTLGFLPLMLRSLNQAASLSLPPTTSVIRHVGDLGCGGLGEILILA